MTVRLAMGYSEVDLSHVDQLIEDDNIALEQKVDGTRALVVVQTPLDGEPFIQFLGRGGGALKHTAAMQHFAGITKALKPHFQIPCEVVIDGEVMIDTGEFVAFDLPYMEIDNDVRVRPELTYYTRLVALRMLIWPMPASIRLALIAMGRGDKYVLLDKVRTVGGEGVI